MPGKSYRSTSKTRKDEVFDTLRREILAARLKVTLDGELKRPTSPTVKRLAAMKLPPVVEAPRRFSRTQPSGVVRSGSAAHELDITTL